MSRDFVPGHRWDTNEPSTVNQKYTGTALVSFPIVRGSVEDEARLIMGRLVREYLERRPIES
jgi:hypothetical protein